MKLLVLSDLHLEFSELALPADVEFDVAVLAGDIVSPGSRAIDWVGRSTALASAQAVVLVPGNHEFYDRVMTDELALMRRTAASATNPPVHVLDLEGVVIEGVRFLGCTLWTDFGLRIDTPKGRVSDAALGIAAARRSMVDYRTISVVDPAAESLASGGSDESPHIRMLTPEDTFFLHQTHRAWLERALAESFDGPTVVVTHHGPHRGSLGLKYAADWVSTAFINELPASFFEVPVLWVHGHTHSSFDYLVGRCRVVCNPRGYQLGRMPKPENPDFDPARVFDVE